MREGALSRQEAVQLVETAATAPSMHNLQPWRFVARLSDAVIEIYADPSRALGRGDPRGRAVHIACGAALFNLRLAIAHAGAEPVARLLPNPRDPLLLAAVRIAGPHRPRPGERDLHAAIRSWQAGGARHHVGRATIHALMPSLAEAAALEGASLHLMNRADALRVLQSVTAADRSLQADPSYLAQLSHFNPAPGPHRATAPLPGQGHLAMLATRDDDRGNWLRAGQALQRVLLLATYRGLSAAPLSPVLELPDAPRRPEPRYGAGYPEVLVTLSADAAGQFGRPSQRRPVGQVMRVVSAPRREDEGPRPVPRPALAPHIGELLSSK